MNNFDFVAPFYDKLARFVFGSAIEKATCEHLPRIGNDASVLVLGGGTGRLLERIPRCDAIDFIDSSSKMAMMAKRRKVESELRVEVADIRSIELSKKYDAIICPFFLDCFDEGSLETVLDIISKSLSTNGILIVTDFQGDSSLLIKAMHLFFRLFAGLEAKKLLNIHDFILRKSFSVQSEEFFHKNMIFSRVYGNL